MNALHRLRILAPALFIGLASVAPAAHAALIGYYTFEDSLLDLSGNGNHGSFGPTAPTFTASGYQGGAYQFGQGGANTFITVPVNINPSVRPQLTMGAWVNADVADAVIRGIISHDNGGFDRTLTVDTRNNNPGGTPPKWQVFNGGGTVYFSGSNGNVVAGAWTFLAAVYDLGAGTTCFYLDGAYGCVGGTPSTDALNVTYLGRNPNFDFPFIGRIDNVFFFDEALSKARLDDIYANGIRLPEPGSLALAGLALLGALRVRRTRAVSQG